MEASTRGDFMLGSVPPPDSIPELWRLLVLMFNRFEERRLAEMKSMESAVTRLLDGDQRADERIDDLLKRTDQLESLRDQVLPRVPLMVERHETEIQELRRLRARDMGIAAGVSAFVTFLLTVIGEASGLSHIRIVP